MALISTSVTRCRPGRRDDFLALALEGMKLFERHGVSHARLLGPATAGKESGTFLLTNEFDTAAGYGSFVDDLYRDAETDALLARIDAPESPLVITSRCLATEIPLPRRGPRVDGSVVGIYLSRITPGQFSGCCELVDQMFAFLEGYGATNCRLFTLSHAGSLSGAVLSTSEFETIRARGVAADAWAADPYAAPIRTAFAGPDPPRTLLWSGLYRDLHM